MLLLCIQAYHPSDKNRALHISPRGRQGEPSRPYYFLLLCSDKFLFSYFKKFFDKFFLSKRTTENRDQCPEEKPSENAPRIVYPCNDPADTHQKRARKKPISPFFVVKIERRCKRKKERCVPRRKRPSVICKQLIDLKREKRTWAMVERTDDFGECFACNDGRSKRHGENIEFLPRRARRKKYKRREHENKKIRKIFPAKNYQIVKEV